MMAKSVGAIIIQILHCILILWVLLGWLADDPFLLLVYFMTLVTLQFHWILNNDMCCLTLTEKWLFGRSDDESFMHQLISPVYKISDRQLAYLSKWVVNILIVVVLIKFWRRGLGPRFYWNLFKETFAKIGVKWR
jgi:hypothetical protein